LHPNLLNKWNEVILGPFLIYLSLNKCLKKKPCTKSFLESLTRVIGWTKKAVLFSLATILRSKTLLIYQSLNINRHYHIQTKWPKFKQEKTQKQEELQGKFQALPRWDMNLWMWRKPKPKKRIYRHKYQKELKQYKKFIILMIARENNESRQKIELITKWKVQFIKAAKHKHKKIKKKKLVPVDKQRIDF